MKNIIFGLGKSGIAAGTYLVSQGQKVVGYDKEVMQAPFPVAPLWSLEGIDRVIVSPGIDPRCVEIQEAKQKGVPVIGEMELGLQSLKKTEPAYVIGVTGSNGKTTTCMQLAHQMRKGKKIVFLLGNIGEPLCNYLQSPVKGATIILEMSSFQLETARTKALDLAVVLNVFPNHLNRYENFSDYKQVKKEIVSLLKPGGKAVVGSALFEEMKTSFPQVIPGGNTIESIIQALLEEMGQPGLDLTGFIPPSYRMQHITTWQEIAFYNDSKSTNPAATIYAVSKIHRPIILLVGGLDKDLDYALWKKRFSNKVQKVIAMGSCREKIAKQLAPDYDVMKASCLQDAWQKALSLAKPGDAILFSPGASSLDQFKNFEERGKAFTRLVTKLKD